MAAGRLHDSGHDRGVRHSDVGELGHDGALGFVVGLVDAAGVEPPGRVKNKSKSPA